MEVWGEKINRTPEYGHTLPAVLVVSSCNVVGQSVTISDVEGAKESLHLWDNRFAGQRETPSGGLSLFVVDA